MADGKCHSRITCEIWAQNKLDLGRQSTSLITLFNCRSLVVVVPRNTLSLKRLHDQVYDLSQVTEHYTLQFKANIIKLKIISTPAHRNSSKRLLDLYACRESPSINTILLTEFFSLSQNIHCSYFAKSCNTFYLTPYKNSESMCLRQIWIFIKEMKLNTIPYDNQAPFFTAWKCTVPLTGLYLWLFLTVQKEETQGVCCYYHHLVDDVWITLQGYKLTSVNCWSPKFSIITE